MNGKQGKRFFGFGIAVAVALHCGAQSTPPAPAVRPASPPAASSVSQSDEIKDWQVIDSAGFYRKTVVARSGFTLEFINKSPGFDTATGRRMVDAFFRVYPEEVKRFNPGSLKKVCLVIDPAYHGVAATQGGIIRVDPDYVAKHPGDIDIITHEAMHVVQAYPGAGPGWITEGIADYARYKYGVDNTGANWRLPVFTTSQAYTDSYRVTARFLVWLEKTVDPKIVDKLDAVMREGKYGPGVWKKWTGKTIDELWGLYAEDLGV